MSHTVAPWDPHEHEEVEDDPADNEGGTICRLCGLVLSGPLDDEAKEIAATLKALEGDEEE